MSATLLLMLYYLKLYYKYSLLEKTSCHTLTDLWFRHAVMHSERHGWYFSVYMVAYGEIMKIFTRLEIFREL